MGSGRAIFVAGYAVDMLEPHDFIVSKDDEAATTMLRICNGPNTWTPGQYIGVYLPALGTL